MLLLLNIELPMLHLRQALELRQSAALKLEPDNSFFQDLLIIGVEAKAL